MGVHQEFELSTTIFEIVVNIIEEHAIGLMEEILYLDDLFSMSDIMEDLRNF